MIEYLLECVGVTELLAETDIQYTLGQKPEPKFKGHWTKKPKFRTH